MFLNVLSKCVDRIIFRATFFSEWVKLYSYLSLQSRGEAIRVEQEWDALMAHLSLIDRMLQLLQGVLSVTKIDLFSGEVMEVKSMISSHN